MRIVAGDITNVTTGIVVHQVNCRNRIGAGVSGPIVKKWPEVETSYHRCCSSHEPTELLGQMQAVVIREPDESGMNGLLVVNSFTQMNYGNAAKTGKTYTDMRLLVKNILKICYQNADATVYVPYGIGCGLAGGNWNELLFWLDDVPNLVAVKKN